MNSQSAFIGDPLICYTKPPCPLGERVWNDVYKCWMVMLANLGASDLTAGMVALASGTDRSNGGCRISSTAGGDLQVAGVRPDGSATIPAAVGSVYNYGWFICGGPALNVLIAGTDVTAADMAIVTGTTAGKIEAYSGLSTNAGTVLTAVVLSQGIFAYSQRTSSGSKTDINIIKSVYN